MSRIALLLSVFTAGFAVALSVMPLARADDSSFVSAAKQLGFAQSTDNLTSMGRSACYFLSRNRTEDEVVARIVRYAAVDHDRAQRFFDLSVAEYCPA